MERWQIETASLTVVESRHHNVFRISLMWQFKNGIVLLLSTSGKTTMGLLPPSSRVTRFKFDLAAVSIIALPTAVEPVNAILSMCL